MKKTIGLCFLILPVSLVLAQGPGGGFHGMGRGPGGPRAIITGAPYSGTETVQSQENLADGNRIAHKRQTVVYRDSQGRVRSEETNGTRTAITIIDPVAGYRYMLDPSTMTAHQSPLPRMHTLAAGASPAGPHTPPPPPDGATVVSTNLGTASVNGVAATGTQITETIAPGAIGNTQAIQIVRVTWIANDLKVPVQIKSSDPRFGTTDMELTNISTSEPSASLFLVPAGYTVQTGGGMTPMGRRGPGPGPQSRGPRQQ